MARPEHTAGPWHAGAGNGEGYVFADSGRMRLEAGGTTLYPICKVMTGWDAAEDAANLRAIPVLPELLAACRALFDAPHHDHFAARLNDEEMAALDAIRSAVEKATGVSVYPAPESDHGKS